MHASDGGYDNANFTGMATAQPNLEYDPSVTPSNNPFNISVYNDNNAVGGQVWAAAALSWSGTCFMIKDDQAISNTTYGSAPSSASCTGNYAAANATSDTPATGGW